MDLKFCITFLMAVYCQYAATRSFQISTKFPLWKKFFKNTKELSKKIEEMESEGNQLICIRSTNSNSKASMEEYLAHHVAKLNAVVEFVKKEENIFSGRVSHQILKNNCNANIIAKKLLFNVVTKLGFIVSKDITSCDERRTVRSLLIELYRNIYSVSIE